MVPERKEASFIRRVSIHSMPFLISVLLLAGGCAQDGAGCLDTLRIVTSSSLYSEVAFDAEARWAAGGHGCPDNYTWSANAPLAIVGPTTGARVRVVASEAGTGRLNVRAGAGTEFAAARDLDVLASTGFAWVTVDGLAEGVDADIVLTGPGETVHVLGDTVVAGLEPGIWRWQINQVTGGIGHRWVAVNAPGTFTVLRNTPALLPLEYRRVTAQINFEARGVPLGTIGDFVTVTRDSAETFTFNTPLRSIAVEPGRFTWRSKDVDLRGYWFVPTATSGQFRLGPDYTVPFVVEFVARRGFLDIRAAALPEGVFLIGRLFEGADVHTIEIPGAGYRSPATYVLDVPALIDYPNLATNRFETFRPAQPTRQVDVMGGTEIILVLDIHLATWHAMFDSDLVVTSDPLNTAPLIRLPQEVALRVTVDRSAPTADEAASVDETIRIDGPPPWVNVAGPLAPDSSFIATGKGTVAGHPNVDVSFSGRLLADGNLEGALQLGSDTATNALAGGPVRMDISGVRRNVGAQQQSARTPANTRVRIAGPPRR